MRCPCECDHWHHLAAGFQGIVSMMGTLNHNGVTASDRAIQKMEEQLALLADRIAECKKKGQEHGTG